MSQTVYSNVNILLNTTESLKSCLMELCSFPQNCLFQKAHILQAGGTSFSVKFPTVWSLTPVKFPGFMGLGEGGMDGNVWN